MFICIRVCVCEREGDGGRKRGRGERENEICSVCPVCGSMLSFLHGSGHSAVDWPRAQTQARQADVVSLPSFVISADREAQASSLITVCPVPPCKPKHLILMEVVLCKTT